MSRLDGRIALVTGASRGIGYHAAAALAREGAHVIAVARTVGGLEELDDQIREAGGSATLVPLDLLDFDAIDRLGASIHERWGKLDVLLGNAGMLGGLSPIEHFEPKNFEKVMALNVTANWRLIRSLSPLLHAAGAGRAIFMTARQPEPPRAFWGLYGATQAALQMMVKTWASEARKTDLRINLLDPGPVRTALRAQAMPGEDPSSLAMPSAVADAVLFLASETYDFSGHIYVQSEGKFV